MPAPLDQRIATPQGKRRYVRTLFATIADRYDLITVLLSYGQDRRWKRRLVRLARPAPDARVLDLATGTGDIAFAFAGRGSRVVGLDLTPRMIELARDKPHDRRRTTFLVGDMVMLPFQTGVFDIVTTGYGLRNVVDLDLALAEMARVLRPGGQALALDFDRPLNRLVRWAYFGYLAIVGGAVGWLLHRDPDTYRYIPASLATYPGADEVARMMRARGFARVRHYRVLGGLMAIHHGYKRDTADC